MKFDSLKAMTTPTPDIGQVAPSGDDWLSRVNSTLTNFRELLKAVNQMKGMAGNTDPHTGDANTPALRSQMTAAPSSGQLSRFFDLIISQGYGNATVNDLMAQVGPLTVKQIQELLKHAGLTK